MEGKYEGGLFDLMGGFFTRYHRCDCGCNIWRMGAQNAGSTATNLSRNLYKSLTFLEAE